jgi:hypothetical protein
MPTQKEFIRRKAVYGYGVSKGFKPCMKSNCCWMFFTVCDTSLRLVGTNISWGSDCCTNSHQRAPRTELLRIRYLIEVASHGGTFNGQTSTRLLSWARSPLKIHYYISNYLQMIAYSILSNHHSVVRFDDSLQWTEPCDGGSWGLVSRRIIKQDFCQHLWEDRRLLS